MTVINMMSFGDSGAAVADEQSSGSMRKYNVAQKLRLIDNSVICGGSGSADFVNEAYDVIEEEIEKDKKEKFPEDIYELTKAVLGSLKGAKIDKMLFDNYGIRYEEFQTGSKSGEKLDDDIKSKGNEAINHLSK